MLFIAVKDPLRFHVFNACEECLLIDFVPVLNKGVVNVCFDNSQQIQIDNVSIIFTAAHNL